MNVVLKRLVNKETATKIVTQVNNNQKIEQNGEDRAENYKKII